MSTQLRDEPRSIKLQSYGPTESRSVEENMLQQHLFNTNKDPKYYLFINTGASIPISTCNFIKNRLHIVSGTFIPSFSQYSRNDQRFKVDNESPSLLEKDSELFVKRLLFTSELLDQTYKLVLHLYSQGWNYHQTITKTDT